MRWLPFLLAFFFPWILFAQDVAKETFKKEDPKNPICIMKTSLGDVYIELFPKEAPKTVENFIDLAEGKKEFKDSEGKMVKKPFYDNLNFHRIIKGFMIQGGCPKGDGSGGPGYSFDDEINADALGLDKINIVSADGKANPRFLQAAPREVLQRLVQASVFRKMGIKTKKDYDEKMEEIKKNYKDYVMKLTLKDCYETMGYKYSTTLPSRKPLRGMLAMANSGPNTNGSQFFVNVVDTPWLEGKHTVFGKVIKGMDVVDQIVGVKADPNGKPDKEVKILSIRLYKEEGEEKK